MPARRMTSRARTQRAAGWRPIGTFRRRDRENVDLWLVIHPSPMSMGWGDSFRVPDAYRKDGRWFHMYGTPVPAETEIDMQYVTHWMPIPRPPRRLSPKPARKKK